MSQETPGVRTCGVAQAYAPVVWQAEASEHVGQCQNADHGGDGAEDIKDRLVNVTEFQQPHDSALDLVVGSTENRFVVV